MSSMGSNPVTVNDLITNPAIVKKVATTLQFSESILGRLLGESRATPEELAEYRAKKAADEALWASTEAELALVKTPIARAVLDLHGRDEHDNCLGCDSQGWEAEQPEYPCRTTLTVAKALGYPVPETWIS